jgi:hypothetical protein
LVIGLFISAFKGLLQVLSSGEETGWGLLPKIDLLKNKIAFLIEKRGEYTSRNLEVFKNEISSLEK